MDKILFKYFSNSILVQGISFVGYLLLVRKVSSIDLGMYALIQAVNLVLVGPTHSNLTLIFERNYNVFEKQRFSRYFSTLLVYMTLTSSVIFFIILNCSGHFLKLIGLPKVSSTVVALDYVGTSCISIIQFFHIYFRNQGEVKRFNQISLYHSLMSIILSLAFNYIFDLGLAAIVLGNFLTGLFICLYLFSSMRSKLEWSFSKNDLIHSLKSSSPFFLKSLIAGVSTNIDKFFVNNLLGISDVGVLSVAQRIGGAFLKLTSALENTYIPTIHRLMIHGGPGWGEKVGRILTPFIFIFLGIILSFSSLGDEISIILGRKEYQNLALIILFLGPSYAIQFFGKQNQITLMNKNHYIPLIYLLRLAVLIPNYYVFIPHFGLMGVAMTLSITEIIVVLVGQTINQRLFPIEWEMDKVIIFYSSFFLFGVALYFIQDLKELAWATRIFIKFSLIFLYALLGYGLKIHKQLKELHDSE